MRILSNGIFVFLRHWQFIFVYSIIIGHAKKSTSSSTKAHKKERLHQATAKRSVNGPAIKNKTFYNLYALIIVTHMASGRAVPLKRRVTTQKLLSRRCFIEGNGVLESYWIFIGNSLREAISFLGDILPDLIPIRRNSIFCLLILCFRWIMN